MELRKILIANRGEIAVRVVRAARELDIATVQPFSAADREMLAAQLADEIVPIGPAHAAKSYLNQAAIVEAACRCGADAIHPGYGFLSENPSFAEAVEQAGLVFIGPRSETIRLMGDKARARQAASAAGVATVPGTEGRLADDAAIEEAALGIGFPVMLKAAAGGGGRGIRVAEDITELRTLVGQARAEARAAFGDDGLYLERFIARARHIEVQVLGDGERVIHLYERECSLQRRRQKLLEEAPAACLAEAQREALCAAAVRLARSVGYRCAGTVEFLFDDVSGEYYFIEMNTRIQVEHPVSEMITGIDLVREMIRIAAGARLGLAQAEIGRSGHAIECRINAEDPANGFRPSPGQITSLSVPGGPGVRFDSGIYAGYHVPPFYDSLLGKLIVWDNTRAEALRRLARALGELEIGGIASTIPLFRRLLGEPDLAAQAVHTRWLEVWLQRTPLSTAAK